MNLNTITDVRPASGNGADAFDAAAGDAWLAGGTWLFSEPQPALRRLIDLHGFGWDPLTIGDDGLSIAATCTLARLAAVDAPPAWTAAPLIGECCRSLLGSFKVWNAATVGGNICMSLPAGPMTSLAVALEATLVLWPPGGGERRLPPEAFVTGNHQNALRPGEVLRAIEIPAAALSKRTAFRRLSLTHLGRSTALLVGTRCPNEETFLLTVTAATVRPFRLAFDRVPDAGTLRERLHDTIADGDYHDDVHGSPDYRKHLTLHFAEEIRRELAA